MIIILIIQTNLKKIIEKNYSDALIQDILKLEQIIDGNCKSLMIAHGKGFQLLGLFRDKHFKKITFQHYFLNMKDHLLIVHIKK
jgi:hypothetical protein